MFSSDLCRCVKSFTEDSEKLGNNVAWQAANNVVTVAENHQNLFSLHYLGLNFGLVSVNILEKKGQCHKHVQKPQCVYEATWLMYKRNGVPL